MEPVDKNVLRKFTMNLTEDEHSLLDELAIKANPYRKTNRSDIIREGLMLVKKKIEMREKQKDI